MNWEPEATPQTADQLRREPLCPEVIEAAVERDIASIVHFTRVNPGLVGILDSSAILPRRDLPHSKQLKYAYEPNAIYRDRDSRWHGYVNLSVTKINRWMFQSSKKWHPEADWVILGFGPEVLGDPGVVFCTTNNAYTNSHRCRGLKGFEQMFAPRVPGYSGQISTRDARQRDQTTDHQAEVLYPSALSLDHLQSITVGDEATIEAVDGALSHSSLKPRIVRDPEAFR